MDRRINKYHVEAADNAKFLGAIEKSSHAIYLEVKFGINIPLKRKLRSTTDLN